MTVHPRATKKVAATKTNFPGHQILRKSIVACNSRYCFDIMPFLDKQAQTCYSFSANYMTSTQQPVKTKCGGKKGILGIKKPKRSLTCYIFFFRHERARLLGYSTAISNHSDNAQTRRRLHRKTHGRIGFIELSKCIGDKWNQLSKTERALFDAQAAKDLIRYRGEMEVYQATATVQPMKGIGDLEKSLRASCCKQEDNAATRLTALLRGTGKLDKIGEVISSIDTGITSNSPNLSGLEKRVCKVHDNSISMIEDGKGIFENHEPSLSGGSMKDLENDLRRILSDDVIDGLANLPENGGGVTK